MTHINVNHIVHYGDSSEEYQVICICMTGAGEAAFIQSRASGFFIAIQPDEFCDLAPRQTTTHQR